MNKPLLKMLVNCKQGILYLQTEIPATERKIYKYTHAMTFNLMVYF